MVSQSGFSIGFKGGYGYSQYFFRVPVEQVVVPVYQYGLVISQMNKKNFGVEFNVLHTQKAFQEKFNETYFKQVTINYIEFPILSTYKIGNKKSALVLFGGLHLSVALNVDSLIEGTPTEADTSLIQYSPFEYSNWNYGLGGGLAYQLILGKNVFQLQLMYSQGLQNLFERDYASIYRSLNQNLFINLTYKVSLEKRGKVKKTKTRLPEDS